MTQDDVVFLRSWFENYTKRFPTEDAEVEANLRYKKEHSLRVRNYMLTLGRDLQLEGIRCFSQKSSDSFTMLAVLNNM